MSTPSASPEPIEAPLPGETQGAIRIIGYPICKLSLKIDSGKSRREGKAWKVVFTGITDVPNETSCAVKGLRTPEGATAGEQFDAGVAPLKRTGDKCSLELELDIVDCKLLGKGKLAFTFEVQFPHGPKGAIEGSLTYEVKVGLEWEPKPKDAEVPFGQKFLFTPKVDQAYQEQRQSITVGAAGFGYGSPLADNTGCNLATGTSATCNWGGYWFMA